MATWQRNLQRMFRNNPGLNQKALQLKKSWDEVAGIIENPKKKGKNRK
ncbi:hypothetical protein [Acetivibrio ethanolgignens]|nr:hypothetical protein [Acetivibrio ethanolgignens]